MRWLERLAEDAVKTILAIIFVVVLMSFVLSQFYPETWAILRP